MAAAPKSLRRKGGDAYNLKDPVQVPPDTVDLAVAVDQLQGTVNELIAKFNAHKHVESNGVNEIQSVTISATGGHFHLIFGGQTSAAINYDASAATVQTELGALSSIGVGNVVVTGNAGGPYTVTFQGALGETDVASMTTDATALTGGAGTAVVAVVQAGVPEGSNVPDSLIVGTAVAATNKFVNPAQ